MKMGLITHNYHSKHQHLLYGLIMCDPHLSSTPAIFDSIAGGLCRYVQLSEPLQPSATTP
jgi:hypothetical protein